MKYTIKKLPCSQIEIEIEISSQEFDNFIRQATLNAGRDLEMPGFRKGKIPQSLIEEKIGKENLLIDAADMAVKENYRKVVLDQGIEAISQPNIDILKMAPGNPFVFRAKTAVLPEIALPDYREIARKIEKNKVSVDNEEIENTLKWLQKSRAKMSLKNEPAQKGDLVEIEYWSPQIKEISETQKKRDSFILGDSHFIPGFDAQLTGVKSGDEKEFSLALPENHPLRKITEEEVNFRVKVISVQKVELPELNDEFAKAVGSFENLLTLKKNIKDGIYMEKEQAELQRIRAEILEKISRELKCEIPEDLIKKEQEAMLENFKKEVSDKLKISFEDYLKKINKTEQELIESFNKEAQEKIKRLLILREIGKKEKIEVSEQEVKEETDRVLRHYSDVQKAEKALDPERLREYIKEVIINEKIFKLLESLTG